MHSAGATLSLIASLLGAWQFGMLSQRVEQGNAAVQIEVIALAIDLDGYRSGYRHLISSRLASDGNLCAARKG
jgi:hypothetical protein